MSAHPGAGERVKLEIADIVRAHRAELEAKYVVTLEQRRVLSAMALCRTAALGGHLIPDLLSADGAKIQGDSRS